VRKQTLRHFAFACLALLACALPVAPAHAQPSQIKIVVPYTPGSGPDILSRLMANEIGRAQSVTVLVENRPGGGTLVGTELVARADPDGGTLLLIGNSFAVNPALGKGSYDLKSFAPVCHLASTPLVLVVKGDAPYRTLADMLAAARAKPGDLSLASGGPASALHVAFEVVRRAANVTMTYVPYGGTAPAINALMGGHVTSVFADYPTVVAQLQSGALRGLVTTSPARVPTLPDVPTLDETGSPSTTPRSSTASWRRRRRKAMCSPGFRTGSSPRSMRPRPSRSSPRKGCSGPGSAGRRSTRSCARRSRTTPASSARPASKRSDRQAMIAYSAPTRRIVV
jgi:tripartite-type tricarboxylate transporter receptor subunit TctC